MRAAKRGDLSEDDDWAEWYPLTRAIVLVKPGLTGVGQLAVARPLPPRAAFARKRRSATSDGDTLGKDSTTGA